MSHNEFNELRHTAAALPPEQMRQLRHFAFDSWGERIGIPGELCKKWDRIRKSFSPGRIGSIMRRPTRSRLDKMRKIGYIFLIAVDYSPRLPSRSSRTTPPVSIRTEDVYFAPSPRQ